MVTWLINVCYRICEPDGQKKEDSAVSEVMEIESAGEDCAPGPAAAGQGAREGGWPGFHAGHSQEFHGVGREKDRGSADFTDQAEGCPFAKRLGADYLVEVRVCTAVTATHESHSGSHTTVMYSEVHSRRHHGDDSPHSRRSHGNCPMRLPPGFRPMGTARCRLSRPAGPWDPPGYRPNSRSMPCAIEADKSENSVHCEVHRRAPGLAGYKWFASRLEANRRMHAINGNGAPNDLANVIAKAFADPNFVRGLEAYMAAYFGGRQGAGGPNTARQPQAPVAPKGGNKTYAAVAGGGAKARNVGEAKQRPPTDTLVDEQWEVVRTRGQKRNDRKKTAAEAKQRSGITGSTDPKASTGSGTRATHDHTWKLRKQDWQGAGIVKESDLYDWRGEQAQRLVVHVDDPEDIDLLQATAQRADHRLTAVIVPNKGEAEDLRKACEAEGRIVEVKDIPGVVSSGAVRLRKGLVVRCHKEAVGGCEVTPAKVSNPQVNATKVLKWRVAAAYVAEGKWNGVKKDVTTAVQQWFEAVAPELGRNDILSIFKIFIDDEGSSTERMRGCIRLSEKGTRAAIQKSGKPFGGVAVYIDPFEWDDESCTEPYTTRPRSKYVTREQGEDRMRYVARVWSMCEGGVLGASMGHRELATRVTAIPGERYPETWSISEVPKQWCQSDLEGVLAQAGYGEPQAATRPYASKGGMVWKVRAIGKGLDFEVVDYGAGRIVVTKAVSSGRKDTARPVHVRALFHQAAPPGKDPDKTAAQPGGGEKRPRPIDGGEGQQPTVKQGAETEGDHEMETTAGGKTGVKEETVKKDTEKSDSAQEARRNCSTFHRFMRAMTVKPVKGDGNCAWRSIHEAMCDRKIVKDPDAWAKTKQRIVTHMAEHGKEYQEFWDGKSPDVHEKNISDKKWEGYIDALAKPGSWGGDLEIYAASRKHDVPIIVADETTSQIRVYTKMGVRPAIALVYKDKHYDWLEGKIPPGVVTEADRATPAQARGGASQGEASSATFRTRCSTPATRTRARSTCGTTPGGERESVATFRTRKASTKGTSITARGRMASSAAATFDKLGSKSTSATPSTRKRPPPSGGSRSSVRKSSEREHEGEATEGDTLPQKPQEKEKRTHTNNPPEWCGNRGRGTTQVGVVAGKPSYVWKCWLCDFRYHGPSPGQVRSTHFRRWHTDEEAEWNVGLEHHMEPVDSDEETDWRCPHCKKGVRHRELPDELKREWVFKVRRIRLRHLKREHPGENYDGRKTPMFAERVRRNTPELHRKRRATHVARAVLRLKTHKEVRAWPDKLEGQRRVAFFACGNCRCIQPAHKLAGIPCEYQPRIQHRHATSCERKAMARGVSAACKRALRAEAAFRRREPLQNFNQFRGCAGSSRAATGYETRSEP